MGERRRETDRDRQTMAGGETERWVRTESGRDIDGGKTNKERESGREEK